MPTFNNMPGVVMTPFPFIMERGEAQNPFGRDESSLLKASQPKHAHFSSLGLEKGLFPYKA